MSRKPEPPKPIMVWIGDTEYRLRYTLRAMKELEEQHGINFFANGQQIVSSPSKMPLMLLYGLRADQPEVTEDWLLDNVDTPMLLELLPMMVEAATGKRGQPVGEQPKNADGTQTAISGTGGPPGPSDAMTLTLVKPNSGI